MASRIARTSSTMGSEDRMMLFLHEFEGRANDRRLKPVVSTDRFDPRAHRRVGDVRTVPREQAVHAVHRGDRNVKRIGSGLGWEGRLTQKISAQGPRFYGELQQGQIVQCFQS